MIYGIDVSHWQKAGTVLNVKPDFVIIKASEGKSYKDPLMAAHAKEAEDVGALLGFYHYARPEVYTYKEDADNFISRVKPYLGRCVLALDWEGKALSCSLEWALAWLNYVEQQTGVKPMFYTSISVCKHCKLIADNGNGLWVARYNNNPGKPEGGIYNISPWKMFAVHQYTSKPIDHDVFNGSKAQFKKYM